MIKRAHPIAVAFACLACLQLAVPAHAAQNGDAEVEARGQEPRDANTDRQPDNNALAVVAAGLGAAILALILCQVFGGGCIGGKKAPKAGKLIEEGPQFPEQYDAGTFPVYGFIEAGWPIIVDFSSERGTMTWLDVGIDEKRKSIIWLDTSGEGGLARAIVEAPAELRTARAERALFVVRSARIGGDGRLLVDAANKPVPAALEVSGIGAGPGAVGSIAIDQLRFRQATAQPGAGFAPFGFRAVKPFNRSAASVIHYRASGSTIRESIVRDFGGRTLSAREADGGIWDGFREGQKRTAGLHRLQVRAWKNGEEDLSWVGTVSRDKVEVR